MDNCEFGDTYNRYHRKYGRDYKDQFWAIVGLTILIIVIGYTISHQLDTFYKTFHQIKINGFIKVI